MLNAKMALFGSWITKAIKITERTNILSVSRITRSFTKQNTWATNTGTSASSSIIDETTMQMHPNLYWSYSSSSTGDPTFNHMYRQGPEKAQQIGNLVNKWIHISLRHAFMLFCKVVSFSLSLWVVQGERERELRTNSEPIPYVSHSWLIMCGHMCFSCGFDVELSVARRIASRDKNASVLRNKRGATVKLIYQYKIAFAPR